MNGMLETIVRGASRIMQEHENAAIHQKDGHSNFVTDADLMVQEYLHEKLHAFQPGSVFFAEEKVNAALTDAPTWVVDPIDGTHNFMRRRKYSAVSVALLENREPVLGIVFNPYANELFRAEKGVGVFLNGHPIQPSTTPFQEAIVSYGTSPYHLELADKGLRAAQAFLKEAGDLRRLGSAALEMTEVACGRSDIFFEMTLSPWDYAAASLIVREAGAAFYMPLSETEDYGQSNCILACNMLCRRDALRIVRDAAGAE